MTSGTVVTSGTVITTGITTATVIMTMIATVMTIMTAGPAATDRTQAMAGHPHPPSPQFVASFHIPRIETSPLAPEC